MAIEKHTEKQQKSNNRNRQEKQLHGYFKRLCKRELWTWLRKGKLKSETEYLLVAAQNNTIRTNYIKAKIDNMQ